MITQKQIHILLHFFIWGILFAFPLLFTSADVPSNYSSLIRSWQSLFFSVLLFYINYFYLIDKYLFQNKTSAFIIFNIVLVVLSLWGLDFLREMSPSPPIEFRRGFVVHRAPPPNKWFIFFRYTLSFLLTSGISVAIRSTQKWQRTESEKEAMERENLKSELSHLRYQLQPHFFFNALNNIYSLMDSSPVKAKESIHGLAKLMRHILYETKDERITLAKEVEFLENAIRLMRLRLTDMVSVNVLFPEKVGNQQIAPLLLIPLVENAFKHGVSTLLPTCLFIEMKLEDSTLYFKTSNTYLKKSQTDHSVSGIGIANMKKRLELLYPNRFTYKQEIVPDTNKIVGELYTTELTIQL